MKVIYPDDTLDVKNDIAASVGFFDGVHKGHRYLIEQLKSNARQAGLPSVVITFPIHPRKVLDADYQPKLLTSFEEKLFQLSTTGIDYCYVIDFTKELSEFSASRFLQEKLCKQLRVKQLLIGYDHRFGKGRASSFSDYVEYGKVCGMDVIQAQQLQEDDIHYSSTFIRDLLMSGDVKKSADMLSYNYTLEGLVITGDKLGRKIGFPTANLSIYEKGKVIPMEGIYAVKVHIEGKQYKGMAYIGNRPTVVEGGEKRIEVNILNFSEAIYGKTVCLEFVDFLRPDMRFDNLDDLKKQLFDDKEKTIQALSSLYERG